jgi:broad specificity phosphatase PhoE
MTSLLVCRHGTTDWNIEGRYQGQSDVPLNQQGLQQAEALAEELALNPIDAIYASALQRAWRTAEATARRHNLPIKRDARLNEVNLGIWEGLTRAEIVAAYAEEHTFWVEHPLEARPPGGESIDEVRLRVRNVLLDIGFAWPDGSVMIVTHKVTMNIIESLTTGQPLEEVLQVFPVNGSVIRLEMTTPMTEAAKLT